MAGSDENFIGGLRPSTRGDLRAVGGKINVGTGQTRRALSAINENIQGAQPFPSAVHKRGALTEKFSAQNGAKKQHQQLVQEPKPIFPSVVSANASDGCIIINVSDEDDDDYKTSVDYPIPMSVQHTEAFLDEIDRLDAEVEMEDVDEEPVLDIDHCDKEDPLEVVEYIDDIYAYYKRTEMSSYAHPDYMLHQSDINQKMRAIVIDWLVEVHYKFELMDETLYLTINLIDRFLEKQLITKKKLQLVGVTAMLIACKYEEVSVPIVEDFIFISDKAYTRKEVLDMESLMINTLQFNLSVPTPYVFMKRFLKAAESDKQMELMSFFMIELCLIEYEMLKFSPSLLAAAAIFTAQCCCCGAMYWSKTCEKYTTYTQDQLLGCSKVMVSLHQKAGTGELTGVHRKYSLHKYGYAAKSKPAVFLLDDAN